MKLRSFRVAGQTCDEWYWSYPIAVGLILLAMAVTTVCLLWDQQSDVIERIMILKGLR